MTTKRTTTILNEIYRRAFAASTPQGDWDELLKNATTNDFGQKVIPFMDYELDDETAKKIIEDVMKEYRVPKWQRKSFALTYWLGCSPKTKMK